MELQYSRQKEFELGVEAKAEWSEWGTTEEKQLIDYDMLTYSYIWGILCEDLPPLSAHWLCVPSVELAKLFYFEQGI